MEPGVAVAAYGTETAAEGAIGAGIAVARSTMPVKARFHRILIDKPLPRSSHSLSVIKGRAYIFGGEIKPREPVDNNVHIYTLPSSSIEEADYECVVAVSIDGDVPAPRVGHTAVVISDQIYVFGGRGGKDMQPLDEHGRVWVFHTNVRKWSHIDPVEGRPYPAARSYHTSTSNDHPIPSQQHTLNPAGGPDRDAHGTIFVHGGCPSTGRAADVWSFDIAAKAWSQLPDAPGPPRGGSCLAFAQNRLYRFGGFDGQNELGGQLDYLEIASSTFDNKGGEGELAIFPRQTWETNKYGEDARGPGNRSVAGLLPLTTGQGRNFLLLFLGERSPSSKGHDGAGAFWGDVWSYQLRPDGMTAASIKDATRKLVGAKTGENSWSQVEVAEETMSSGLREHPGERGWFAYAQGQDVDQSSIVLWGGINRKNEREGDGWILTVET
ncbi:hypothetical protein MMC14_001096 [Varicellaria rhodocarpa]|nr:hypothetical protein [Varicellaria rhodocarpa]